MVLGYAAHVSTVTNDTVKKMSLTLLENIFSSVVHITVSQYFALPRWWNNHSSGQQGAKHRLKPRLESRRCSSLQLSHLEHGEDCNNGELVETSRKQLRWLWFCPEDLLSCLEKQSRRLVSLHSRAQSTYFQEHVQSFQACRAFQMTWSHQRLNLCIHPMSHNCKGFDLHCTQLHSRTHSETEGLPHKGQCRIPNFHILQSYGEEWLGSPWRVSS